MNKTSTTDKDIAKAIAENRIFFKPTVVTYYFYGSDYEQIDLLDLVRIAFQAGRIYGKRKRKDQE